MVVVWWCQHPTRELAFVGVLHLCGGVVVWCCLRCVYVEQRCSAESVVSRPFRKHPAQELMSSFRANLSTFRRSAI